MSPRKHPQELAQNTSWPNVIPPFLVVRDILSGQDLKVSNGMSGAQARRHVAEVDQSDVVQPYVLCEGSQGIQWGRGTRRSPARTESGMEGNYYISHLRLERIAGFKEVFISLSKCRQMQKVMAIVRKRHASRGPVI